MAERTLAPLQDLLNAADSGLIKLPEDAVKYRAALAHLGVQLRSLTPPDPGHAELEAAVIESALAGTDLPDARFLAEREIDRQALEQLQAIGRAAHERLEFKVREALTSDPDGIVVRVLRPVHDRLVAEIRGCAKTLNGELDKDALLMASAAKRQARQDLDVAVAQYRSVRQAYRALDRYRTTLDTDGKLLQWRNPSEQSWRGRSVPRQDAVGADPAPTLVAQLASGLQPWMPTSSERDARFEELFPRNPASGQRGPRVVGVDHMGDRISA